MRAKRARDRLGNRYDPRDVREGASVYAAQREEYVARDDESRARRPARGEGGERVVSRDVRVDYVCAHFARESCESQRAAQVERVAERHVEDVGRRERFEQRPAQRRVRGERGVDFVAALGERAREVGEMSLAAAERARGADL